MLFASAAVPHWDFPRGTASVALLVAFGEENGLAATELLVGSGLSPADLTDSGKTIEARQELAVANNLVGLLGERPALGLEVGARYRIATFGIFGFACLTSRTLGEAARFALRYYELSFGFCLPSITLSEDGVAALHLTEPPASGAVGRFLILRDLAAIHTAIEDLIGGRFPLLDASLTFDGPDGVDYESRFAVTPRFNAPANTASFDAGTLSQPLPQASELTVVLCENQCRELVAERSARSGIALAVRDRLVNLDPAQRTITAVARSLAMSERTLRRRLTEAGTSYRQLLEEVDLTLAQEMLRTGALSVDDVAMRLGYAEASSFIAAFKRWTGETPARYQRASDPRRAVVLTGRPAR